MRHLALQAGIRCHQAREVVRERLKESVADERGEVGSWLIVAAGLAIAAAAAVGPLGQWIADRVTEITNNTGAGGAAPGGGGPP